MPKVITKHSSTASAVPVAADLEVGELAVNTFDGKLFTKHTDNSIKDLSGSGGSATVTGRGNFTINFGSGEGSNEATATVSGQTDILSTSVVNISVKADSTSSDHSANDHKYLPVFCSFSVGTITDATGFSVYATSEHKLTGTWTVHYNWIQ